MKIIRIEFIISIFLSLSLLILLPSCNSKYPDDINPKQLPKWTISINEIIKYPRASVSEEEVPSFNGESIWVRKHYELDSKNITEIVAVPSKTSPGFYDLNLKLDNFGSLIAMRLSNDLSHDPWAFLVERVFYRTVQFNNSPLKDDYSEILITGPFDKATSDFLQKYSKPNYTFLNDKNKY